MKIPKLIPGEEFTDLDLLSKLLQPKRTAPKSKIEVLGSEENLQRSEDSEDDEEDQEEAIQNWEIEQSIVNEERDLVQSKSNSLGTSCLSSKCPEKSIISDSTYGFGNERSDIFQKLEEESSELFENYKISTVPNDERSKLRLEAENE